MAGKRIFVSAILALFVIASAGTLYAGGGMHESKEPERMSAPEPGTWEYQEALETGSLPPSEAGIPSRTDNPAGEDVETYEAGGVTFRAGVDDGA